MADTPPVSVNDLLAEALAWDNPGQPAQGPTFNPPGPRLPSAGRAGFNPGPADPDTRDMVDLGNGEFGPPGSQPVAPAARVSPPVARTAEVAEAAQRNARDLFYGTVVARNTGAGANNRTQVEVDVANLPHDQLIARYGVQRANLLRQQFSQGTWRVADDTGRTRDAGELALDTAIGVPTGFASGLGSLGALGLGVVNDRAGAWAARQTQALSEWSRGLQSEGLQARARVNEVRSRLNQEENDALRAREVEEGASPFMAGLRSLGRGAVNGVGDLLADPLVASDAVAQGIGSLYGGSIIGRGLSALGKLLGTTAITAERGVMAAVTGLEAGGAYTGASNDIQGMSFEDLERTSPEFRDLVSQGMSREDARIALAGDAGHIAAAVQAPFALAASRLTARFEAAPTHVSNARTAAGNLLREFLEEGSQSGTGQFAQNVGIQRTGDESRSFVQGVGEQAAQGALIGLGTAGVLQAPGVVSRGVGRGLSTLGTGAQMAAQAASDLVASRAERVQTADAEASPIGEQALTEVSQEVTQEPQRVDQTLASGIEETSLPPEEKSQILDYANRIVAGSRLTDGDRNDPALPEAVRSNATDTVSLLFGLAKHIHGLSEEADFRDRMRVATSFVNRLQSFQSLADLDSPLADALPEGSEARSIVDNIRKLMANIQGSPKIIEAILDAREILAEKERLLAERARTQEPLEPEDVQAMVALASVDPSKIRPEVAERVMNQAAGGGLQITPMQRASLQNAIAIGRAEQRVADKARANGHVTAMQGVSEEILAKSYKDGDRSYRKSAVGHSQGVLKAFQVGDSETASALLGDMGLFVQHMNNKVQALNTNFETGKPQRYMALQPDRSWQETGNLGVTLHSPKSIEFAQKVSYEAERLAAIYNSLVDAFPALNQERIESIPLVPSLEGNVEELARQFRTKGKEAPAPASEPAPNTTKEEVTAKPEPKVEEKPAEVKELKEPKEPKPKPAPITALFPSILGSITEGAGSLIQNGLAMGYRIPAKQRTRTIGSTDVAKTVQDALSSQAKLTNFLGGDKIQHKLTPEVASAYGNMLSQVPEIRAEMDRRLAAFLAKTYQGGKVKGMTRMERLLSGYRLNLHPEGKFLNITEHAPDGSLTYNQELVEGAILAGLQWLITASKMKKNLDAKDVAEILGKEEDEVSPAEVTLMNSGVHRIDVHRNLADTIQRFWGLEAPSNMPQGIQKGIALSVAGEVLESLVKLGALEGTKHTFAFKTGTDQDGFPVTKTRDFWIYNVPESVLPDDSHLFQFPSAIEQAVVLEPESVSYYGDQRPKVARTQLNNPYVENTPEQRAMIEKHQRTEYFVNPHMARFYELIGLDNAVKLFGFGELNGKALNDVDRASQEGVNLSVTSAYQSIMRSLAEMKNIAGEEGFSSLPVRYAFNITSVGRLQMLGAHNPQATKLVREMMLPTWSTLDLSGSNPEHRFLFDLALAQALDIKVHKLGNEAIFSKLESLLKGDLAPVVQILETLQRDDVIEPRDIAKIQESFAKAGQPVTPLALHALTEYAKLNRANEDELKAFRTSVYVEADGMTNGVVNAMAMLTSGSFTPDWVTNMAKGGMSFDPSITTANQHFTQRDTKDLYETAKDALEDLLGSNRQAFANAPAVQAHHDTLVRFMGLMLPDMTLNADGSVTIKRGVTKNPLTITLYGSGQKGIAAKMVNLVMDEVYTKISVMAEAERTNQNVALALFGDEVNGDLGRAENRYALFRHGMLELTGKTYRYSEESGPYIKNHRLDTNPMDMDRITPKSFELKGAYLDNFRHNMLKLFIQPMGQAIEKTVGETLLTNARLLQQSTQAQSIVLQHMFLDRVKAEIEAKRAADPAFIKSSFLSQDELNGILDSLGKYAPSVQGRGQSFFVSGSTKANFDGIEFGSASDGTWSTGGYVWGPSDAGVKGIPLLNIGYGDGYMIQSYSLHGDAPTKDLPIFDGINMALDQLRSGARLANEAVWDSWQGNPLRDVSKSFGKFMDALRVEDLTLDMVEHFSRVFLTKAERAEGMSMRPADIMANLMKLDAQLKSESLSVEARHRALQGVSINIEQMAAAQSPYQTNEKGAVLLGSPDEVSAALEVRYQTELRKLTEPVKVTETPAIKALGNDRLVPGAREISVGVLSRNAKKLGLSDGQQAVLTEILRSKSLTGYKIITGTPESILAYQTKARLSLVPMGLDAQGAKIQGVISVAEKRIYLPSTEAEPLVHELVHASTFEKVLAALEGNAQNQEDAEAVKRIQALKAQFLEMGEDFLGASEEAHQAYLNAVRSITNASLSGDTLGEAKALNEFMAWGLTNKALGEKLGTAPATGIAKLVQGVIAGIRKLIFGRRAMPKPAESMFSNLLFNASILMRSQPMTSQVSRDLTLHMSTAFGTSDRLVGIQSTFDTLLGNYLNRTGVQGALRRSYTDMGVSQAQSLGRAAQTLGFGMNAQEQSVFESIVTGLAVHTKLEPSALVEMEKLYRHTIQNLDTDSFRKNQDLSDQADAQRGADMYGVLVGSHGSLQRDGYQRSHILPVFFGLAAVNDEFRQILNKLPMPEKGSEKGETLDAKLENFGLNQMEKLSNWLSGADPKAPNVQRALDALVEGIQETAQKKQSFVAQFASAVGNQVDKANEFVVGALDYASERAVTELGKQIKKTKNPVVRGFLGTVQYISALASKSKSDEVSQGAVSFLNKAQDASKHLIPVREFMAELVGRTQRNAPVVDLLKAVRTMVQQSRQQFRTEVPKHIAAKFKTKLTSEQWSTLFRGMGKTDLASLYTTLDLSRPQVLELLQSQAKVNGKIQSLEASLAKQDSHFPLVQKKAKQLAQFMTTGEYGSYLLRNAKAVAELTGIVQPHLRGSVSSEYTKQVDGLITLYALKNLAQADKLMLAQLAETEHAGMDFTLAYLVGQRSDENTKAYGMAAYNHYKGYVHSEPAPGMNLIVADDREYAKLRLKSYVRVADYEGSRAEANATSRGYYMAPVSGRAPYNQGVFQNVRHTSGGVDISTGFSHNGMNAGVILDPKRVADISKRLRYEAGTKENLLPLHNAAGTLVGFERALDPMQIQKLNHNTQLHQMIGAWRGRQVEEHKAQIFNEELIKRLHKMWKDETTNGAKDTDQYVNIFDAREADAVVQDAQSLLNRESRMLAEHLFGENTFMVRKDMLNDALGYRKASIGDVWTGNSRWSPETQRIVQNLLVGTFGNDAYARFVNGEALIQNVVKSAKELIVIKSVVVPAANFGTNILQLIMRGVPVTRILRDVPRKVSEIDLYVRGMLEIVELDAELRAAQGNPALERKLKARIENIQDTHKRLSIWPLIARGEFSSITEAGRVEEDDQLLSKGKLMAYIEAKVDQLPEAVKTAGRYAIISKDTALFKGLQRSVAYGDFIAKAIMFDDLISRQGKSQPEALGQISEEFVNYDRLPGRFRGYFEDIGLWWFGNYMIRSVKVSLSILRNNPVHAFLASMVPIPAFMGSVELPTEGALFTKIMDGSITYSMGFGQGLHAPMLHPLVNLVD